MYIEEKVNEQQLGAVYQPQIAGDSTLANKAIEFVAAPSARVNWNRLLSLDTSKQKLQIISSKTTLIY